MCPISMKPLAAQPTDGRMPMLSLSYWRVRLSTMQGMNGNPVKLARRYPLRVLSVLNHPPTCDTWKDTMTWRIDSGRTPA